MRWKRLPAGPRPLAEPDPVEPPELIQEQARRLKTHSPTFASAANSWVVVGPRKAYRTSVPNRPIVAVEPGALAAPTQDLVLAGNRPAEQRSRLNQE
jgi:hypothetical protein